MLPYMYPSLPPGCPEPNGSVLRVYSRVSNDSGPGPRCHRCAARAPHTTDAAVRRPRRQFNKGATRRGHCSYSLPQCCRGAHDALPQVPSSQRFLSSPITRSSQVRAVILAAQPDVVVVELDQERLERLMKTPPGVEIKYGADFAAAAAAAEEVGAPIILGDAKARDTVASLRAPGAIADPARLWRATRMALGLVERRSEPSLRAHPVRVAASLRDDPAKLLPLLAGFWWTIGLTAASALMMPPPVAVASANDVSAAAAPSTSWLAVAASCALVAVAARVVDVLLLSRDETLAGSSIRALELAAGLQSGGLLRHRYAFATDAALLSRTPPPPADAVPFFTLRRPLGRGEVRRLSLFEPRWLRLLDQLAGGQKAAAGDCDGTAQLTVQQRLEGATFGCVFAVNRCYTPRGDGGVQPPSEESVAMEAAEDGGAAELGAATRVADVVVRPYARRVRIVKAEEGTRPVTGARRMVIYIEGEGALAIDEASLAPTPGGYLAGRVTECTEEEAFGALKGSSSSRTTTTRAVDDGNAGVASHPVRVVSVVGMAHANGVLDRCALAGLCDDGALARAALEEPSDWVGY
jgi:hypothetical protein